MIHWKTAAGLALAALALSACQKPAPKQAGSGNGAAAAMPKPKAGLWENTTAFGDNASQTEKICLDDPTANQLAAHSASPPGAKCDPLKISKGADGGFTSVLTCTMVGGGSFVSTSTETGDMNSAYSTAVDIKVAGAAQPGMNGEIKQTVTAKYDGPCPSGWSPGDVELPTGKRVNLLQTAAPAPKSGG